MKNEVFQSNNQDEVILDSTVSSTKAFVSNVFAYMFLALTLTGVIAWWFGNSSMINLIVNFETGGLSLFGWIATLAPFAFILVFSFGLQRMSYPTALLIFLAFATCMGISLSTIFLVYSSGSIALTFGITSLTFGIMAIVGYTTKTDLTKFGSIMMMGLIGIILAMVVNWFIGSERLDYIISVVGVLIFTGLIAYDTQKIKRIGAGVEYGTATASKLALYGALSLYLDFINLFLFLLRFLGNRD